MSVRSAEPAAVSMRYPRWFVTLFLTDIWERFSFYGMAAVLTLYAAAPAEDGGLGLDKPIAAALFGSYLGLVFLLALPGGWLGDRVFGVRRATAYGCGLIVLGHYCMAIPVRWTSYLGLLLVAAGTGLLKPNMAALLSDGYGPDERTQREAAFSIFYVSIQVSALAAPLIVGALSENLGWHWGFAAAGVGMTFGVIQFLAGGKHFGDRGLIPRQPASPDEVRRFVRRAVGAVLAFAALIAIDVIAGTFAERHLIIAVGLCAVVVPFAYFVTMMRNPLLDPPQRRRLRPFFWLLLSFSLFWLLAGQTGSMLNLFARQHTDRSMFGITLPASWFQSAVPLFILLVAPFFAWLWVRMAERVSTPVKFAVSLLLAGAAFLVMSAASGTALDGTVSPLWLVGVFFLLACGEVIIGPVGISTATGVTSAAYAGRTVGLLWLFSGFGAGLASQVVHLADVWPDHVYYLALGTLVIVGGLAVMVFRRTLAREITAQ